MAEAGAAAVIGDEALSARAALAAEVGGLLGDPARLEAMAAASAGLARPGRGLARSRDQVLAAAGVAALEQQDGWAW